MSGAAALSATTLLEAMPGRSLVLSPDWSDEGASVAFDRNSGDYWVITNMARAIVERIARGEQAVSLGDLEAEMAEAGEVEQIEGVIDDLLRAGVLRYVPGEARQTAPGPTID